MANKEDKKQKKFLKTQLEILKKGWDTHNAMQNAKNMGLNPPISIDFSEIVQSVHRNTLAEYSNDGLNELKKMIDLENNSDFKAYMARFSTE